MTVLAISNQKGGVGKTSTAAGLADAFAARFARKVLLVDLDPQASLSEWLLPNYPSEYGVEDALLGHVDAASIIQPVRERIDLLPATNGLDPAERELERRIERELILGRTLAPLVDRYDLVVIDGPPRLTLLTQNSLFCADWLLIPAETSSLSVAAARDLLQLVAEINESQGRAENPLRLLGLVFNKYDQSTSNAQGVAAGVSQHYPVLPPIRRTVRVEELAGAGAFISDAAPGHPVVEDYATLAEQILDRIVSDERDERLVTA